MTPDSEIVNNIALVALSVLAAWNARQISMRGKQLATIKDTTDTIHNTTETIHTLSNGRLAAVLTVNLQFARSIAVLTERVASITGEDGDIAAARAANLQVAQQEALLNAHLMAQSQVELARLQKLGE